MEIFRFDTREDVAAFVVRTLGFYPADSLVAVALMERGYETARWDLRPNPAGGAEQVAARMSARGVKRVILCLFGPKTLWAEGALGSAVDAFEILPVSVLDAFGVDHNTIGSYWRDHEQWRPFDLPSHPFLAGQTIEWGATRETLTRVDETGQRQVAEILACGGGKSGDWSSWGSPTMTADLTADGVAQVLAAMSATMENFFDKWLMMLTRQDSENTAKTWRHIVANTPREHAAGPAIVLGFCEWLRGDGARANAAHEYAEACGVPEQLVPAHANLGSVTGLPPTVWDRFREEVGL